MARTSTKVLSVPPNARLSGSLPLEDNLSYRLSILNFLMARATQKIYLAQGLSMHQWKVLTVLNRFAPMPATDVAKVVTLDKSAISRAVRQLLELGLASRSPHPRDARSIAISLTPKGVQVCRRMTERSAALQRGLLGAIPGAHVKVLFGCIDEIERRLRRESGRRTATSEMDA
jgi:DNA-binding MarR family transcriptional regulator